MNEHDVILVAEIEAYDDRRVRLEGEYGGELTLTVKLGAEEAAQTVQKLVDIVTAADLGLDEAEAARVKNVFAQTIKARLAANGAGHFAKMQPPTIRALARLLGGFHKDVTR